MASNVPPELEAKFKECKDKVIAEGNSEEAAYGICYTSVVEGKSMPDAVKAWMDANPDYKIGARHSRSDLEDMQTLHDIAVKQGANCLKAISETPDELRVANYIVLFDGKDLEGVGSPRVNPDGSKGEHFSQATDLESSYTKTGHLHVDWEHGQDPDNIGNDEDNILGYVDWKTAKRDDTGWYVERVLNRRNDYMKWLEGLIKEGLVGNSTQAVSKSVQKTKSGEITRWPLKRDTLTVNPMEPRMLTQNPIVEAYKALGLTNLIPSEADRSDKGVSTPPPNQEKHTMEPKEVQDMLDAQKAALMAELAPKIEAVETALKAMPEVKAGVAVTHDPADNPFKSLGEQIFAMRDYENSHGQKEAPRLKFLKTLALKAPLGMSEGVNADGGFLLEPTITPEVMKPVHDAGPFYAAARKLPVSSNSNSGWINGIDETSRAKGSRWGGVQAYHRSEVGTATATKPKFRRINWQLDDVSCLFYLTDDLMQDAAQAGAIANSAALEELGFQVNDDIFRGSGVGMCKGFTGSPALVSVARITLAHVNMADILAMWTRVLPRSRANGAWYINSDVEPELDKLATVSNAATTEFEPRFVQYGPTGAMSIKGRPVIVNEFSETLGTVGDIVFADMSEYLFWEKGGVQSSVNPWLQWLTNEQAVKFTMRVDGQTSAYSAITPAHGTATQSAFVALATSTS